MDIAKWCPTVHNLQPQKIKVISENRAELYYDSKGLLPHGDPNQSSQQLQWVYLLSTYQLLQTNLIMVKIEKVHNNIDIESKGSTLFLTCLS